jgi:hypothetical protein
MLRWEDPAPMSVVKFLEDCQGNMKGKDYTTMTKALAGEPCANGFVRQWEEFQQMVRMELSEQRSKKLNLRGDKYRNSGDREFQISEAVRNAIGAQNPLEGELILLRLFWEYLDDASVNHMFDLTGLLAYSLKLRLLERKSEFDTADGNKEFDGLLGNLKSMMKGN